MLRTRIITSAIALPLLVLYVLKLPAEYFTGLIALVAAIGLMEFYAMYRVEPLMRYAGVVLGVLVVLAKPMGHFTDALMLGVIVLMTIRLFSKPGPEGSLADTAPPVLGLLYVPGLLCFILTLYGMDPALVIFLFGTVWAADSAAYFAGTRLGRHKLYESMSPNKTWEGAAGSVLGGSAAAVLLGLLLLGRMPVAHLALAGLVVGTVTIVSDLVESMFKRDAGVKDSGTIFPGHGGILDKVDGSLFGAPALYWTLKALGEWRHSALGGFTLPF